MTHPRVVSIVIGNAKQKHLGCKKVQGQSEATLQTGRHDQKVDSGDQVTKPIILL